MDIKTFTPTEYFGSNSYVLISDGEAAIIDPSIHYKTVIDNLGEGLNFKYIILTHVHFDHMWYIDEWKDKTCASVLVGEEDAPALTDSNLNAYRVFLGKDKTYTKEYSCVKNGDVLNLGSESLTVIDTPGHTKGGISIFTDGAVFVGDTVFSKTSIGRTDLPGGA